MTINVYLLAPPPFAGEGFKEYQGVKSGLFNDIAGKVILDVLITEEDLTSLLTAIPQIMVMEAFQPNGKRVGLEVAYDEDGNEIITGSHKYLPDAALANGLKDKKVYDNNGNENSSTPRVLADDDVHHWAGWAKRDFTN